MQAILAEGFAAISRNILWKHHLSDIYLGNIISTCLSSLSTKDIIQSDVLAFVLKTLAESSGYEDVFKMLTSFEASLSRDLALTLRIGRPRPNLSTLLKVVLTLRGDDEDGPASSRKDVLEVMNIFK